MATSGSSDLTASRNDIITEALELIEVLGEGDTPNAAQLTSCGRTLNYMVKSWQGKDIGLWAIQPFYVFLEKNKSIYTLSSTGDHCTTSYVSTQLDSAHSASSSSISVNSIQGISDGDNISVGLSDGARFWTTVNGTPTGTTITLTDVLTGDAASGAYVYAYTTKAPYPYRVLHAILKNSSSQDRPLTYFTRDQWINQTNKTSNGSIVSWYYDPKNTHGELIVWPQSFNTDDIVVLYAKRVLEDFDADNDADFPQDWFLALAYNLALKLCPKYGVSSEVYGMVQAGAAESFFDAGSQDTEGEIQFMPDPQHRWGRR